MADWGVARADLIWVLNGSLIGMAIGSVVLGRLGDRVGRKRAFIACLLSLCAGSLLSAHATGLRELFVWRAATGIGLGGLTPLATTFISEWTPRRVRSIAVACAVVSVPLGGMLGAMVAQRAIPSFGWRAIFWIGTALPLLFVVLAAWLLPESPRFLAQDPAHVERLAAVLNRLVREPRLLWATSALTLPNPQRPRVTGSGSSSAASTGARRCCCGPPSRSTPLGLYTYANWLPTRADGGRIHATAALQQHQYFNFGGFFGAIGGAILIGHYGSRLRGHGAGAARSGRNLAGRRHAGAPPALRVLQLSLLVLAAGAAFNGMQSFVYAVGAHSYPTYVRGAGSRLRTDHLAHRRRARRPCGRRLLRLHPQPPLSSILLRPGYSW